MMNIIKNLIKENMIGNSLSAMICDFKSLSFNFQAIIRHLINYHFSRRLSLVNNLHFGCGNDYKPGFLNVDLARKADVFLDARNKMPFKDNQIDLIYSSHFLEHLTNKELFTHLSECYRILKPGGSYRICIPDLKAAISSYLNENEGEKRFLKISRDLPITNYCIPEQYISRLDYLDRALHENGHHKIYIDYERLKNFLCASGFLSENVIQVGYDESIDNQWRRDYSIYVLATKH